MGIVMTTSVQVSERTLQLLNKLKQEEGLRSHDQLIRELISVRRKLLKEVEARKETRDQRRRHLEFIRSSSQIIHIDFDRAAEAGEIDVEMKKKVRGWGLVDSIILTLARSADAKVVTGDEHFREIKEAIMIKEKP